METQINTSGGLSFLFKPSRSKDCMDADLYLKKLNIAL